MSKWFNVLVLIAVVFLARPAFAQVPPAGSANDEETRQQMRETMQSIVQKMIEKGMNPQDFFQQLRDGADPADVQKQLIEKGILDQATADQLQTNMQKLSSNRVRDRLDVTDAEWAALEPLIRKVMAAAAAVGQNAGGGGGFAGGFLMTPTPAGANVNKATRELRAAIKDTSTSPERYSTLLKSLREAREQARAELETARKDLTAVLTVRQEGILTTMGILE